MNEVKIKKYLHFVILSKAKKPKSSYSCIKILHFVQDDIT